MICYRDETFCLAWEDCLHGHDCPLALTPKVEEDAKKWWGGDDAPIAMTKQLSCFESKDEMDNGG